MRYENSMLPAKTGKRSQRKRIRPETSQKRHIKKYLFTMLPKPTRSALVAIALTTALLGSVISPSDAKQNGNKGLSFTNKNSLGLNLNPVHPLVNHERSVATLAKFAGGATVKAATSSGTSNATMELQAKDDLPLLRDIAMLTDVLLGIVKQEDPMIHDLFHEFVQYGQRR